MGHRRVSAAEQRALVREAVEMRRADGFVPIGADAIATVLVGHQEQDVWAFRASEGGHGKTAQSHLECSSAAERVTLHG